jgi:hypothetical protein
MRKRSARRRLRSWAAPLVATVAAVAALAAASGAGPAHAAFLLGDASPGSLAAVSLEGPRRWLLPGAGGAGGERPDVDAVAFSHGALFDASGLTADAIDATWARGSVAFEGSFLVVGEGPLQERTFRLAFRERRARSISLCGTVERLDLSLPETERAGGWALGVSAAGRWCRGRWETAVQATGARVARTSSARSRAGSFGSRSAIGGARAAEAARARSSNSPWERRPGSAPAAEAAPRGWGSRSRCDAGPGS